MGQIFYSFDPTRELELNGLFELLNKYYNYIPENPQKLRFANFGSNLEKDNEINKLKESLKFNEKEAQKNKDKIDLLESKLKDAEESSKLAEEDSKKKAEELQKLTSENSSREQKLKQDYQNEINKIKAEKEKEIEKLNKDILDLRKRIAVYEPLVGDTGKDKFFNIERTVLFETMSDDAPIVGKVDINGNAIYQFNVEKGSHKSLSQDTSDLENFFDIIDRIEGANHISMGEWGKAKYHDGTMEVTSKAKIKLTRE